MDICWLDRQRGSSMMAFRKTVQTGVLILFTLFFSVAMAEPIARMSDKGVKGLGKTIAK